MMRRPFLILLAIAALSTFSLAQITNTRTNSTYVCSGSPGHPGGTGSKATYSNWAFTDSAGAHPFAGTTTVLSACCSSLHSELACPATSTTLNVFANDGAYYLQARGATGTAAVAYRGFINPKYVIVGVTYAPPGPNSNVTYTNSAFVGNTTTTTDSFQTDVNLTISVTKDISAWTLIGGAAVKLTGTESTDYIQGSNSSSSVTISKQTSVSDKTNGTGNAFMPVNHDYDTIWLWLNPLLIYTLTPTVPTLLHWDGYGYDNHDVNGPDIFGVQVGWLNGHFGVNPSIQAVLARSWVTTNEPGMIWPPGEGPGLTATDIATILQADPFTSGTYTLPLPLPSTSADGRFTQVSFPPNPVNYIQAGPGNGGGTTASYNAVYTNTSVVGKGAMHAFKQAFGTEVQLKGGTWLASFTIDIKQSDTLSWMHTWQNTLTTTTTLTNALSVTGPGCPQTSPPCVPVYTGPGEFIVYQDNLYGTFMFYPSN